jgi:hypothetical protein
LFVLLFSLFPGPLRACNVPVFRYALEHWSPDAYQALVFHRQPLTAQQQAAVADLEKAAGGLNMSVRTVDLGRETDVALLAHLSAEQAEHLPWLVVRYPAATAIAEPVWSGPLQAEAVRLLVDSPARQEIRRRILQGESAVWVLLESGRAEQDDAADQLLRAQLEGMQQTMKLPERTGAPEDRVEGEEQLPVRLAFSALRVRRSDPAEALLVRLLLHSEPDLPGRHEPMIFPIFGRGRILYALVGAGITESNLRETASFLIGACSCKVKKETPGIDLLLATNWDHLPKTRMTEEMPPLVGMDVFMPATSPPEARPEPEAEEQTPEPAPNSVLYRNVLLALAAGLVLPVVAVSLWFRSRGC